MPEERPEKAAKKRPEEFAELIIAKLEKGLAPWQKNWEAGTLYPPLNPVSGTVYSGLNRVLLSAFDYADPRWMSFKQANGKGFRVKKGSKSLPVVHWQWTATVDKLDEDGRPVLNADGEPEKTEVRLERPRIRFYAVFHASQLETENGQPIPPFEAKELDWNPNERAEAILEASGASIIHDQRNRAFYILRDDEIHLPPKENFSDQGQYYPIAFHELSHWTRHPSRLNRENGPFGSETYAREELRAHIASWMISQDLGLAFNSDHHASYLQSWLKVLKQDPYEIFRACGDAERIKQYVLGLEQKQEQAAEIVFTDREEKVEPALEAVYLQVPYKEKGEAKKAGARWDRDKKLWYAPAGTDLGKLAKFLSEKEPVPAPVLSPVEELRRLLENNGFALQGDPIMDGKIHRVAVAGKANQKDGAYQAYSDGLPNGWFQNHQTGEVQKWVYSGQQLSAEQKKLMQAEIGQRRDKAQKERERQYAQAAERAWEKFAATFSNPVDPEHPYLKAKGVGNYGLHQDQDGNLLVFGLDLDRSDFPGQASPELIRPSLDDLTVTRHIQTVQSISPEGEKKFEYGSRKKGAIHLIGESIFKKIAYDQAYQSPSLFGDLKEQPEILLAEGYSTGASLFRATGLPVVVAFDAGNLRPVAEALRRKFPKADLTICADNDHPLVLKAIKEKLGEVQVTPELEKEYAHHNKGVILAVKAAEAVQARVIVPDFTDGEKAKGLTDFNDLAQSRGLFAVTKIVSPHHRPRGAFADLGGQADQPAQGQSAGLAL
jgi:antirestriction protein ArdC/phage/plasmid primase-like uncharacterized protein